MGEVYAVQGQLVNVNKPRPPEFPRPPQYSDYVQNANRLPPDELARRNEEYKRAYAEYEKNYSTISENYKQELENYDISVSKARIEAYNKKAIETQTTTQTTEKPKVTKLQSTPFEDDQGYAQIYFKPKGALQAPLLVTQGEGKRLSSLGYSSFYPISNKNSVADLVNVIPEAQIASQVRVYPDTFIQTKGIYDFNKANVIAGQDFYKLTQLPMSVDYSAVYKQAVPKAQIEFNKQSGLTKFGQYAGDVGVTLPKLVVDISSFGGNLGVQNLKRGEGVKLFGSRIKEDSLFGKVQALPLGTAGKVTTGAFIVLGGLSLPRPSASGGYLNTLKYFSPLRIQEGVYLGASVGERGIIKSYKYTDENGITTRFYQGKIESSKVYGFERSLNGKGMGFIEYQTPFIEVRSGGASVKQGIKSLTRSYNFAYEGGGTTIFGEKGGISRVSIYQGKGVRTNYLSGTEFKDVGNLRFFRSGTAYSNLQERYFGGADYNKAFEPSGRYRFRTKILGIELDLNRLPKTTGSIGGGTSNGGGTISLPKTITDIGLQAPIGNIETPKAIGKPNNVPLVPISFKSKMLYSGKLIQVEETLKDLNKGTSTLSLTKTKTKTLALGFRTMEILSMRERLTTTQTQVSITQTISKQLVKTITLSRLFGGTSKPSPLGTNPEIPKYFPPFAFKLNLDLSGGLGKGRLGYRKPQYSYTPSFSAFFFNIRGRRPKGVETGVRVRPITKGFKWFGGIKV